MVKIQVTLPDGTTQTFQAAAKTFSTGSRGFHTAGKITGSDGKKFQANLMLIEVGSKPSK